MPSPNALVELENVLGAALFSADNLGGPEVGLAGRYQLLEVRGRGARGLVVRAFDRSLKIEIAIKLYPKPEEALVKEVQLEAQMLAALRHENIVAVFDVQRSTLVVGDRSFACIYLVMDFVAGVHLRAWIGAKRPGHAAIIRAFLAAGEGLSYAHSKGVLHRDVKPANIVCDRETVARMVDFGLARAAPSASESQTPRQTQYGYTKGTVEYMAPEARKGRADASSDQFAFAVSMWECLSGVLPFDPNAGAWRLGNQADFFGAEKIEPEIAAVLRKALSYDSHDRYATMQDLLEALRAPPVEESPPWIAAHSRPLMVTGVIVISAVLLGIALSGSASDDASSEPLAEMRDAGPHNPTDRPTAPPSARDERRAGEAAADHDEPAAAAKGTAKEPPSAPEAIAPPAAELACSASPFAGRWRLTNRVLWADDTYWVGVEGFYWFDVEVDDECGVTGTLTRFGDSGQRRYASPQTSVRQMEVSQSADDSTWLHGEFKLSGDESRKVHKLNVSLQGDELAGDITFHQYSDRPTMTGILRAARGSTVGAVPTDVEASPCATQCRVLCFGPAALDRCLQTLCRDRSGLDEEGCGPPDQDAAIPMGSQDLLSAIYNGTAEEEAGDKCREHGRRLGAHREWIAWKTDLRYDISLTVAECDVTAHMRPKDGSEPYTASGRINAKGQWFLRPPASAHEPLWGMTGRDPALGAAGDYPRLPIVAYPRR